MWILILVVLTSKGQLVTYEQGVYDSWDECYSYKKALIEELGSVYRATCMEWQNGICSRINLLFIFFMDDGEI